MPVLTKQNLPILVRAALSSAGVDDSQHGAIALELLRHRAIEFAEPIRRRPDDFMELILVGARSRQATRTAGAHLNVFAFAGVVIATTAPVTIAGAAAILLALLGVCSISLSPDQAAFIIGTKSVIASHTIPTAKAVAAAMSDQMNGTDITPQYAIQVAEQLQKLGMPISIGDPPNHVLRHTEWVISVPGA